METPLLEVIIRTSAIYAVLFVSLRLLGKREVSQFTPFDLILLLTLSNAVQNAMVGSNVSLVAGIVAAMTLLGLNFALTHTLMRHSRIRRWLEGTPTLLVRHGKVEWPALKKENLDMDDLMSALRSHGLAGVHEVDLAVMELDGSISVVGNHEGQKPHHGKSRRRSRGRGNIRSGS